MSRIACTSTMSLRHLVLVTCLLAVHAQARPSALPIVADLPAPPGLAFSMACGHMNHGNPPEFCPEADGIEISPDEQARTAAVARAFQAFLHLRIGGQEIRIDRSAGTAVTHLADAARLWGNASAHRFPDEVGYKVACWDSQPAGLRMILQSNDPQQTASGWILTRETTSGNAACTSAPSAALPPDTPLPNGLHFGMTQTEAQSVMSLAPTSRHPRALSWKYAVEQNGDWSTAYTLTLAFQDGKLAGVQFSIEQVN